MKCQSGWACALPGVSMHAEHRLAGCLACPLTYAPPRVETFIPLLQQVGSAVWGSHLRGHHVPAHLVGCPHRHRRCALPPALCHLQEARCVLTDPLSPSSVPRLPTPLNSSPRFTFHPPVSPGQRRQQLKVDQGASLHMVERLGGPEVEGSILRKPQLSHLPLMRALRGFSCF